MKNVFYLLLAVSLVLVVSSCSNKEVESQNEEIQKWEYKIISEWGINRGKFDSKGIPLPEDKLNELGNEGWELVDVYTRIETVHPNFGNEKYVTGLQPNTRTEAVFFILKRPIMTVNNNQNKTSETEAVVEGTEELKVAS